jgi:hypothetical protein
LLATTVACGATYVGCSGAAALANNPNVNTLAADCSNGQAIVGEIAAQGAFPSAFRLVGSTTVFTIHEFLVNGQVLATRGDQGTANGQQLVSCSHVSSTTGNVFTWVGFFTPAS